MRTTASFRKVYGHEAAKQRKSKKGSKQVARRQRQIQHKLECTLDRRCVEAVVAIGLALKANVALMVAERLAHGESFTKEDCRGSIDDFELRDILERKESVRRRATKALAAHGVILRVGSYKGRARLFCNPDHLFTV